MGGIPHYRETEEYVRRVLWLYLIGHIPESEHARAAALDSQQHAKPKAHVTEAKATRRFAGNDGAILDALAEVRRARQQSETSAGAAGQ